MEKTNFGLGNGWGGEGGAGAPLPPFLFGPEAVKPTSRADVKANNIMSLTYKYRQKILAIGI